MFKSISAALACAALVATPTMAAAAPSNPAASLSVAKSVRVSAPAGKEKLAGGAGGVLAAVIAAGIAAIGVIAIVQDSDDDSDSN